MADKKRDYGHSPEVAQMLKELDAALEADQRQRAEGLKKTVGATREMKEKEMHDKVERSSRDATQRRPQPTSMTNSPPPASPMPSPGTPQTPLGPQMPRPQPMMASTMAPPPASPMPSPGAPTQPLPPQMPPPQPMLANAGGPQAPSPMPTQGGPPTPFPPGAPPPQPIMTPEQWQQMQQQVYGA